MPKNFHYTTDMTLPLEFSFSDLYDLALMQHFHYTTDITLPLSLYENFSWCWEGGGCVMKFTIFGKRPFCLSFSYLYVYIYSYLVGKGCTTNKYTDIQAESYQKIFFKKNETPHLGNILNLNFGIGGS